MQHVRSLVWCLAWLLLALFSYLALIALPGLVGIVPIPPVMHATLAMLLGFLGICFYVGATTRRDTSELVAKAMERAKEYTHPYVMFRDFDGEEWRLLNKGRTFVGALRYRELLRLLRLATHIATFPLHGRQYIYFYMKSQS